MQAYINTHKDIGVKQCKISHFGRGMASLKETEAWIHEELSFPVKTGIISLVDNSGLITIKFGFYGTTSRLRWELKKVLGVFLSYGKGSYSVDIKIRDVTNHYDMLLQIGNTEMKGAASNKIFDSNLEFGVPLQPKPLSTSPNNGGLIVYIKEQEGINPKVIEYEY